MKKPSKILAVMAAGVLALSISACGTNDTQNTDDTDIISQQDETDEVQTEVVTGVVIEATMHNVTIEAEDGSTYSFGCGDETEIVSSSGNLGDTVSVEYEGEYKENMVAKKIQLVEEADEDVSSTVSGLAEIDEQSEDDPDAVKYLSGTVTDATMNNITVDWNGENFTLLKTDDTVVAGDVSLGSTVIICYTGKITDGAEVIDISEVAPDVESDEVKFITGVVVDATMNNITIENDDHQYTILKDDDTISDDVAIGDVVKIYHKGSYSDGMVAISILKQ